MTKISFAVVFALFAGEAAAEKPRPNGASCRKDLECASKKCGLDHGSWYCMAPKSKPAPRPSPPARSGRSSGGDSNDEPELTPARAARSCRTDHAAWRRGGSAGPALITCGRSCDFGDSVSCANLERAAKSFCADSQCRRKTCNIFRDGGVRSAARQFCSR